MKKIVKKLGGEFKLVKNKNNIKVKPVVYRVCLSIKKKKEKEMEKMLNIVNDLT